jgi:drug/metabolite transporter (DMT)-like permease
MAGITGEYAQFDPSAISLASILGVAYLIVFGSLIALNCYLWLLTRVSAPKVTTYALVNPVVALLLGALFLGESVTALAIVAAVLVLAGVALVLFQDFSIPRLLQRRRARTSAHCESNPKSESV